MARPQHISDDTIIEALATDGEVTAADLADRLGIGQSTAAKRLAALEGTGSVLRQPGGRVNGVRVADHWSVATVGARRTTPATRPRPMQPTPLPLSPGASGWSGEHSARWCATTWRPGLTRTSVRARWARRWAGPRGQCPTPWPAWKRPAKPGWLPSHPAATASSPSGNGPRSAAAGTGPRATMARRTDYPTCAGTTPPQVG